MGCVVAVALAVLAALPGGPRVEALEGATGVRLQEILAKFDAYAESSRQRWGVPGMAVAVTQGDRVVFEKGYGVRWRAVSDHGREEAERDVREERPLCRLRSWR